MAPAPRPTPPSRGFRRFSSVVRNRWNATRLGKWQARRRELVRQRDAKLTFAQIKNRRQRRILAGMGVGLLATVAGLLHFMSRPRPFQPAQPVFVEHRENGNRVVLVDPLTGHEISRVTIQPRETPEQFERRVREEKQRIAREARPPVTQRETSPTGKLFMTPEEALRGVDAVLQKEFGRTLNELKYNFSTPAWAEGQSPNELKSLLNRKGSIVEVSRTNQLGEIEKTFLFIGENGFQYYQYPTLGNGKPLRDQRNKTGYTGNFLEDFLGEWKGKVDRVYVPGTEF